MDGLWTEVRGQQKQSNDPSNIQHSPNTPTTGLRERGNDTSKSTGRSGRQNAATQRNMRREERVTVQGPVKEQQRDGMSQGGGTPPPWTPRGWRQVRSLVAVHCDIRRAPSHVTGLLCHDHPLASPEQTVCPPPPPPIPRCRPRSPCAWNRFQAGQPSALRGRPSTSQRQGTPGRPAAPHHRRRP